MHPPRPAPCRITAILGLSRRCSKAKWTRRANQWCRRPGVPLCQLRRNELGLGASRAPEGAGRARGCALSFQKCCGKPRSPPMSFGRGHVGCDGGQSRRSWLTSRFLLLPSFWAAWFWGAARAPRSGLVAPCHLVCLHCPAPCAAPNKRQHRARHELTPPRRTWGQGQAETFAPFHPILGPALLGRTGSITAPSSKPQQRVLSRCQVPVRSQAPSPRPHDASRCRERRLQPTAPSSPCGDMAPLTVQPPPSVVMSQ